MFCHVYVGVGGGVRIRGIITNHLVCFVMFPWVLYSGNLCMLLFSTCDSSFQPVLDDWCNKALGMYYPVCMIVHIKNPRC